MSDLISRRAAIDAIDSLYFDTIDDHDRAKEKIKRLPSAQPDNQIHLCDSCGYSYPECPSESNDVIFGNGKGNDNICACSKYKPSAQPEYFDYTDIDEAWEYYAKEQDANLTDNAKQIKDAMWVGYRIGLKSAQPERKRGKWIPINGAYQWKCSNCGEYICGDADCTPYINHYCWNCGADMGGE